MKVSDLPLVREQPAHLLSRLLQEAGRNGELFFLFSLVDHAIDDPQPMRLVGHAYSREVIEVTLSGHVVERDKALARLPRSSLWVVMGERALVYLNAKFGEDDVADLSKSMKLPEKYGDPLFYASRKLPRYKGRLFARPTLKPFIPLFRLRRHSGNRCHA